MSAGLNQEVVLKRNSETKVTQVYGARKNVSVTVKNGRITKVTQWTTLVPGSTVRLDRLPKGLTV